MSRLYPNAPIGLPFSQLPASKPGMWRELQYGPYQFPITFQERNRESTLALIKKKIPFTPGDYNPGNTSIKGRTLEFYGPVATGMIGAGGTLLTNQDALETERQLIAGLQSLGRQSLYTRPDMFIWAYLESFSLTPTDGYGFRAVDYTLKFYADDPRYYGASSGPLNNGAQGAGTGGLPNQNHVQYSGSNDGNWHSHQIIHNGNTKAFPVFVLTVTSGVYNAPTFSINYGNTPTNGIGLGFSKFGTSQPGMQPGDQLVVICDPRPEYSMIACTYYPGGGWPSDNVSPTNAMAYVKPTDFINAVDFQYMLPWISSSTVDDGSGGMNQFNFMASGTAGTHIIDLYYWDTYL